MNRLPGRGWPAWPGWLLLLLAVADLIGVRSGRLGHHPRILAALVALTVLAMVMRLVAVAIKMTGQRKSLSGAAEIVTTAGILLALGAGMVNWLLSLQGFVVLSEGESVTLAGGTDLQRFDAGPLARLEEMQLKVGLRRLELRPIGASAFTPVSHLAVWQGEGAAHELTIGPGSSGAFESLRFFQGAFGFAPRIVISVRGETIMDRVVPFVTRREHQAGVSFVGEIDVAGEDLELSGRIDLRSLDEAMRGHATLLIKVIRNGDIVAEGTLQPGHFAEVAGGYRVGFAGLEKWAEVDISRRNYGSWVVIGTAIAVIGGAFWVLARRRSS